MMPFVDIQLNIEGSLSLPSRFLDMEEQVSSSNWEVCGAIVGVLWPAHCHLHCLRGRVGVLTVYNIEGEMLVAGRKSYSAVSHDNIIPSYLTLPLQIPNLFLLKFHVHGKLLTLGLQVSYTTTQRVC